MKKKLVLILSLTTLVIGSMANAEIADHRNQLGLGGIVGESTGVTGKYWMGSKNAWDFRVGGLNTERWNANVSYIQHFFHAFGSDSAIASSLAPYIGLGVGVGFDRQVRDEKREDSDYFGRLPVGLTWIPAGVPLDIFGEIAPSVKFGPSYASFIEAGVGGRFYF
jgi:hypothetical protein